MIVDRYTEAGLHAAFGIDMSSIDGLCAGAGWGRVPVGGRTTPHRHDETELIVVVRGTGVLHEEETRHPLGPGTVFQAGPFEAHVIENTGEEDLVFFDLYWRDAAAAATAAAAAGEGGFGSRPVFVFSTPPTPNGDLHLGHLSGPYLGADVFVRAQRMRGTEAWHLTGSDDYQSYVVECARREGRDPAATAAAYSALIADTLRLMDIEPDQYTVTSVDPEYPAGLQDFFTRLVRSGAVAAGPAPALIDCTGDTAGGYLYEVDVSGRCPTCGEGTNGNICEECGEPNVCTDLREPRSRHGGPVDRQEVTRYLLPLHEFADVVADHHRLGRVPARLRELAARIAARERFDLPMTHPAQWGVPPVQQEVQGQVIWVWPEMSYGFLHGIEALGRRLGQDWQAGAPDQDWKFVHFFGYDNSFYHAVLYPVLYHLAHPEWQPDIDYHVNEFYLLEHSKFSTSRRHAVWGREILNDRTVDAVRLFLSTTRPEDRRTNFEPAECRDWVKQTLVGQWQDWLDTLGARIDAGHAGVAPDAGNWTPEHIAFLAQLESRLTALTGALGHEGFSLNRAGGELAGLVADTRRFAESESRLASVPAWDAENRTALALELAAARLLAHCAEPVMPRFAAKLRRALGDPAQAPSWPRGTRLVPPGTPIRLTGEVFFAEWEYQRDGVFQDAEPESVR